MRRPRLPVPPLTFGGPQYPRADLESMRYMRSEPRFSRRSFVLALPFVVAAACGGDETITNPAPPAGLFPSNPAEDTFAASLGVNLAAMTKRSNDLYVQDITVGTGATVAAGNTVAVIYTGWFTNGNV